MQPLALAAPLTGWGTMEGVRSPGLSLSCLQNCYAHIDSADNTWSQEASFLSFCHPLPHFSAQKGKHATGAGYLSLPRRKFSLGVVPLRWAGPAFDMGYSHLHPGKERGL